METKLHAQFDKHMFTIIYDKESNEYGIEVSPHCFDDFLVQHDKKKIVFNRPDFVPSYSTRGTSGTNQNPSPEFLKHHNARFLHLKAQGQIPDLKPQDSYETIMNEEESRALRDKTDLLWEMEMQENLLSSTKK